jgi:translation initiation factor 6
MALHLFDIYRSANIGIFARTNDEFVVLPTGLAPTKTRKISSMLSVSPIKTSIVGSRLLGPLMAMNNLGAVVSRLAENEEIAYFEKETGLCVVRLSSRFTSVGNMVAANDKGAVVSESLSDESIAEIRSGLRVPVERMSVASFQQVGAMIATTNQGAIVHPRATEREIEAITKVLDVEVEAGTVNGGVPYVSSGLLANEKHILAGTLTTGPELVILGRVFKI